MERKIRGLLLLLNEGPIVECLGSGGSFSKIGGVRASEKSSGSNSNVAGFKAKRDV